MHTKMNQYDYMTAVRMTINYKIALGTFSKHAGNAMLDLHASGRAAFSDFYRNVRGPTFYVVTIFTIYSQERSNSFREIRATVRDRSSRTHARIVTPWNPTNSYTHNSPTRLESFISYIVHHRLLQFSSLLRSLLRAPSCPVLPQISCGEPYPLKHVHTHIFVKSTESSLATTIVNQVVTDDETMFHKISRDNIEKL